MASKHSKLYDKSPKLERDEDGDMKVKKADEPKEEGKEKTVGEDGSSAEDDGEVKNSKKEHPHKAEMKAMHKRHEEEQIAMHDRHQKDFKEMHKRHAEANESEDKTGEEEINNTEGTE